MLKVGAVCTTALGEDHWELMPGFFRTLFYVTLPFVDFSLYPLTVTSQNSVNPSSK